MTTTAGQRKNRSFRNGSGGKRKSRFSKTSHRRFRKSRRTNKTRKYLKRGGVINYKYPDINSECKSFGHWYKMYGDDYHRTDNTIDYTFLASSLNTLLKTNSTLSFDKVKEELFPKKECKPTDTELIDFLTRFDYYRGTKYFVINENNKTIELPPPPP